MSIRTKIFGWEKKKSMNFDLLNENDGWFYPNEYSTRSVQSLSRSDYLRLYTGWAFVATSTIAQSVASLEKQLTKWEHNSDVVDHPYMQFVTYDLLLKIASYLQLNWSCFIWKYKIWNKVAWLEILRPDIVLIEEFANGDLKWYRYSANNRNYFFQADEVIALHNFNPLQAYPFNIKGMSPMQAVAVQMEIDVVANKWNWKFFSNGASVKDVLQTEQKITDEAKQRLSTKRKNEFQGVNNSHKVAILDSWLQYTNASPNQKEMDFVESRRFTRDEVFAIFKVPKIIAWVSEDFNKASATVAEQIYYKSCILPIAVMIQEKLNQELFKETWYYFEFINVVPIDTEQLERDFNSGAITLNEYRQIKWRKKITEWDTLKVSFGEPIAITYEKEERKQTDTEKLVAKAVENSISSLKKEAKDGARDDYWQKVWNEKILRTNTYEIRYMQVVKNIRAEQEKDMTNWLAKWVKWFKESWNSTKYITMWLSLLTPVQKDLVIAEANEAMHLVWIEAFFRPWSDVLDKYIRADIAKLAKEVDMVTKQKVFDIIDAWNNAGASIQDITKTIAWEFTEFTRKRANVIARTEVTRASNWASEYARKESNVVDKKEWFTATDERVCEYCGPMNWKTIELWENFFDKWDVMNWRDWWVLKLDYNNIKTPWLHPNCRCTLLPVIK